MLYLNHDHCT